MHLGPLSLEIALSARLPLSAFNHTRVMKLNVLWLVILVVSTCVCPSVPDPFKHRMKRVGIAGFQLVSVLLGSISSLLV